MSHRKGFVDVQVNGFKGIDFSADGLTVDDVHSVTKELAARGTMAYCPTICTGPMDMYQQNLGVIVKAMQDPELGGHILGIHLEGPFISPLPGAVGAHKVDCVSLPSAEIFDQFQEWADGNVVMLTLAPERPGAGELIRHASSKGVAVMFGHHLSDNESMEKGLAAGAKGCTHLGNGLPSEIHRHKNPIWWQLACDGLWGMFITDGHHSPAEYVKVALRAKTVGKFIVTSDAAPLAGMPPGIYDGFGKKVEVEASGRIGIAGTGYLAGSGSTMIECMNFLASLDLLTEEELWRVSFDNPLELIGKSPASLENLKFSEVNFDGRKEFRIR